MQAAEANGRARRGAAQRGEEARKQALADAEDPVAPSTWPKGARGKRQAPVQPPRFGQELDGADSSDEDEADGGRRRGAALTPEEREAKRVRRLMRNRASAQQARERKRDWMAGIEERASTLDNAVAELTSKVNALERTNWALRALIKTASASAVPPKPRSEEPVLIMVRSSQNFLEDLEMAVGTA